MSQPDEDICHFKAQQRGDETFTLVAQDITSPSIICEWIRANILTCPEYKLREALECAIRMRDKREKKYAD